MRADDIGRAPRKAGARQSRQAGGASARLLAAIAIAALAGCSNGAGTLLVDPGRYNAYHCNDLAAQAKVLAAREKELRELMDRAAQSSGGAVIGSLAYRTDYESVRSDERLLQREAAAKNCNAAPPSTTQFQSDQAIR